MKCKICQQNEVETTAGVCCDCYYAWQLWDNDSTSWKFEKYYKDEGTACCNESFSQIKEQQRREELRDIGY